MNIGSIRADWYDSHLKLDPPSQTNTSMQKGLLKADAPHVLLVEDNLIALHIIETMATQSGLKFTSATDGERALELAKSNTFDFIITDIGLPGISGYELTNAIRQWEKSTYRKPIPIIGLTAREPHEARKEALHSGMNNMLCKPINLKTIQELILQYTPRS